MIRMIAADRTTTARVFEGLTEVFGPGYREIRSFAQATEPPSLALILSLTPAPFVDNNYFPRKLCPVELQHTLFEGNRHFYVELHVLSKD